MGQHLYNEHVYNKLTNVTIQFLTYGCFHYLFHLLGAQDYSNLDSSWPQSGSVTVVLQGFCIHVFQNARQMIEKTIQIVSTDTGLYSLSGEGSVTSVDLDLYAG